MRELEIGLEDERQRRDRGVRRGLQPADMPALGLDPLVRGQRRSHGAELVGRTTVAGRGAQLRHIGRREALGPHRVHHDRVQAEPDRLAQAPLELDRLVWGERCYMVPWPDGTLLVGATMEEVGFDERTTAGGVHGLLDAACALVPEAADAGVLSARAGLRPGSPDAMPVIGPSRAMDGLVYATGHFRNGVLLAPVTALLVADAMLSDRIDPALEAVGPQRFEGL